MTSIKTALYALNLVGVVWRKSTHSENETDMCVAVADLPDGAKAVRDTENPAATPLRFTADEWAAFTAGVRNGEF